jgi:Right handed beta helix region
MSLLPKDGSSYRTRRIAALSLSAAALLAAAVLPASASAQATRTWVSGVGDDANPCSRTAPCKTFAGAISKTAAGGQISVLDPGGFGCVTITKSITIKGKGAGYSSITASGGTSCITVNAAATDRVAIYGVDLFIPFGNPASGNGIRVLSAASVRVEDSEIYGFTGAGIMFEPTVANSRLVVQNSSIYNNTNTAGTSGLGVRVEPSGSGSAKVTIKDSRIDDNVNGVISNITGTQPVSVSILRSSITGNSGNGLLPIGANSIFRLGGSDVSENGTGLNPVGGQIISWGDNHVAGNTTDGNPTSTIAPKR